MQKGGHLNLWILLFTGRSEMDSDRKYRLLKLNAFLVFKSPGIGFLKHGRYREKGQHLDSPDRLTKREGILNKCILLIGGSCYRVIAIAYSFLSRDLPGQSKAQVPWIL